MPVEATTLHGRPALRWGRTGTPYPYRAGDPASRREAYARALAQGRAVAASTDAAGEDPRIRATEPRVRSIAQARRALRALAAWWEREWERALREAYAAEGLAVDALSDRLRAIADRLLGQARAAVEAVGLGTWGIAEATAAEERAREVAEELGVEPAPPIGLEAQAAIVSGQIARVVGTLEDRAAQLVARRETSAPRALRVVRLSVPRQRELATSMADEVSVSVQTASWTDAGLAEYVWVSRRDGKVRERHRELHGTVHRYGQPPIADSNGQRYEPGTRNNCRCRGYPIADRRDVQP